MNRQRVHTTKVNLGWVVHLLTASGSVLALIGFQAVSTKNFSLALKILITTILIDALDGPMARLLNVKKNIPNFDGTLLDYIVDFTTWVILPAFFILQKDFFSEAIRLLLASSIILSSCYQFCCKDLKNINNTFKRWPSAWSLVIVCLFTWLFQRLYSYFPLYYLYS